MRVKKNKKAQASYSYACKNVQKKEIRIGQNQQKDTKKEAESDKVGKRSQTLKIEVKHYVQG